MGFLLREDASNTLAIAVSVVVVALVLIIIGVVVVVVRMRRHTKSKKMRYHATSSSRYVPGKLVAAHGVDAVTFTVFVLHLTNTCKGLV